MSFSKQALALGVGAALAMASAATAHDFWVQPASFWTTTGAPTPITLQVGHGDSRQRSQIAARRIVRFADLSPSGEVIDLHGALHLGGAADDGTVRLKGAGVHVLVLETDATAQSHLAVGKFNDYLRDEGLTPALELRAQTHRTDTDGSENYRRCAKALVQVGPAGASGAVTLPVGLPLEIVPEVSPYAAVRPAHLPVRVMFEGQPLAGALVKLTDLDHDAAPVETHRSDAGGRAVFALPSAGRWQMNVIWTKPLPRERETDFETSFSSLSFGFPGKAQP